MVAYWPRRRRDRMPTVSAYLAYSASVEAHDAPSDTRSAAISASRASVTACVLRLASLKASSIM